MHGRPSLGAAASCAAACVAAMFGAACVLSFPTLHEADDAGATDAAPPHDTGPPGPRFCADAGSPYCEDFDGDGSFGQTGGPNFGTGNPNNELVAVTNVYFSPPRSLLPTVIPSSVDNSVYLGFTVPIAVNTNFVLNAVVKVDDPTVFKPTPRNVITLQVPQGDQISVAFSSTDILVVAGGVTYDSGVKVPAATWFPITLTVRLLDHTFGLVVGSAEPFTNTHGIGLYPGDASAPPDGGTKPTTINAYFGADVPASEMNTDIHIDNVVIFPL